MSWIFKKEWQDKKVGVRGFGLLDTSKEDANGIYQVSLQNPKLIRFIEKQDASEKQVTPKQK